MKVNPNNAVSEAGSLLGGEVQQSRNLVLDALVSVDGGEPTQVTKSTWGKAAKALKEIKDVCPGVTADEIQRRAANYRAHMPTVTISPTALATHWAKCDRPPALSPAATRPEAIVRRIAISA